MINGRTRLHVVVNGTMTGQRYIDEVLLPHVRLFRGAVGDKLVLWTTTQHVIEHSLFRIVRQLGQVAGRNYPPTNKNTLIRALTEEWDKLPQQLLDNGVQSMVRRVECCITLRGGHIPDEAHFWLNGYVNKQNCRIWSEANPQVYVETPLHAEKLTVWCALWAGGILLQKR
ncbi:hypothetical protein TNCV_1787551 [Trichonephila clavipes]|nr:hypothetical protein TNCV_1787551 [Trichonephila clavipes]